MAKPIPQNRETRFSENEMFFSRTDSRGIIQSGNDVFVRISGYPREKLVGSPHSLIRHPDMPKAVFKLFWDTIQAGKPISAYVKNMASDGTYYWVFATVFPIGKDFLSIRLKPATPLFQKVTELYQSVLEKEKKEGMEKSLKFMMEQLTALGFSSYDDFAGQAMLAEINERVKRAQQQASGSQDSLTRTGASSAQRPELSQMASRCDLILRNATELSAKLVNFENLSSQLVEKTAFVLKTLRSLDLLAINMSTAARRLGSAGIALVAIADGIQESASGFRKALAEFEKTSREMSGVIRVAGVNIATSDLQIDMVNFYLQETVSSAAEDGNMTAERLGDLKENSRHLLDLSLASVAVTMEDMQKLQGRLRVIITEVGELEETVSELEIIRKTGKIEASRVVEGLAEFQSFFVGMNDLVQNTGKQLHDFSETLRTFASDVDSVSPTLRGMSDRLREVHQVNEGLNA